MTPAHPAHPTHPSSEVHDAPTRMLPGRSVFRVVWLPGSDRLRGWCWCGLAHDDDSPIQMWKWLLDHPSTHDQPTTHERDGSEPGPAPRELVGSGT